MRILVVSDGRRGIENQALGLAEAMVRELPDTVAKPATIVCRIISHSSFLRAMPPKVQQRNGTFDQLPDCDIAIGCGRQAIAPLLWLKDNRPTVHTIYVQDPRLSPEHFGNVVAPIHDDVRGDNVISIIGSPHRVTPEQLEASVQDFLPHWPTLPGPRATLLIGGPSKRHKLDDASHAKHLSAATRLRADGFSLMISTSRRTPKKYRKAWQAFAAQWNKVWLYDSTAEDSGSNPYFAFLAAADVILVTEDSTNMLVEACATGTTVYRLPMATKGGKIRAYTHPHDVPYAGKFEALYESLRERAAVYPYWSNPERRSYTPLDETSFAAREVWAAYLRRQGQP